MVLHELLSVVNDSTTISIYNDGVIKDYVGRREVPMGLWQKQVSAVSVYSWKLNVVLAVEKR